MMNDSPATLRLGVPKYDWWTEGLNDVARSTIKFFLQAIGLAAPWHAPLIGGFADTIPPDYSHHSERFAAGLKLNGVPPVNALRASAMQLAQQADVVVTFRELPPNLKGEEMSVHPAGFSGGDRTATSLPEPPQQLQRALAATRKRSVQPGTYTVFVGGTEPTGAGGTRYFHGVKVLPD